MEKADILEFVKAYIQGALKVKMESEFGRGYIQGLQSLQEYIDQLEEQPKRKKIA
jgi:hypothetical protein